MTSLKVSMINGIQSKVHKTFNWYYPTGTVYLSKLFVLQMYSLNGLDRDFCETVLSENQCGNLGNDVGRQCVGCGNLATSR